MEENKENSEGAQAVEGWVEALVFRGWQAWGVVWSVVWGVIEVDLGLG